MDARQLGAELEAALVREIRAEYARLNASYFRRALRPPLLLLSDATTRLGRFDLTGRTLEIARSLALEHPWSALVEVLKHEMAHQYVLEQLGVLDEPPHGPTFRQVCERLGVDAAASGLPRTPGARSEGEERILGRIAKLLALAESPRQHEAEAAMNAAQRLMLKYNLDAAAARAQQTGPAYTFRTLGIPSGRITESERTLAAILGDHFFVEVIWVPAYRPREGKRGSVLEISGTGPNLEMASYVHSFLSHAAERLWVEHKRKHALPGNRDRRTFLAGVMAGFHQKLQSERRAQAREGLVWAGDADLRKYHRRRHPHVVTVRYGGSARNDAHAHGREAGKNLVLHKPVGSGPSGGPPRLLGR